MTTDLAFLKRRITRGLVRDDIDPEELAGWVSSATARISQDLRTREMISAVTIPLTKNSYSLPPGFMSVSKIAVNPIGKPTSARTIVYVDPDTLYLQRADPLIQAPCAYTINGNDLLISPFSVTGYEISMYYFKVIRELENDTDTNLILSNYPDLYFNCSMIFGHQFYLEYDMADKRETRLVFEIDRLNGKYREEKYGDGPLIVPPRQKIGGRFS